MLRPDGAKPVIGQNEGDHRFGHRDEPRQQARVVSTGNLHGRRFSVSSDGRLILRNATRRLHCSLEDNRHPGRNPTEHAAVAIGASDDAAVGVGLESVIMLAAPHRRGLKARAVRDPDNRRQAEQRLTDVSLELVEHGFAEPWRHTCRHDNRAATDTVSVAPNGIDQVRHALGGLRIGTSRGVRFAVRRGFDGLERDGRGIRDLGDHRPDLRDVAEDPGPTAFHEDLLGDGAGRHAGHGFPRAGSATPAVVAVAILSRKAKVGVARPEQIFEMAVVFGSGVAIGDHHRDRRAGCLALEHAAQNLRFVRFLAGGDELALPRTASRQVGPQIVFRKREPGGYAVDNHHLPRAVRFASSRESQHLAERISRHVRRHHTVSGLGLKRSAGAVARERTIVRSVQPLGPYQHPPGPTYRRRWGFAHDGRVAQEIAGLDPVEDCQRIAYLLATHEFPFDLTRSLELALFHTFGARRVAALLHKTQAFERAGQKRYDDTNILIGQFIEAGWDNDLGDRAIRRMNEIHGRFRIRNDDFLFVLWTFIDFPISWMADYGWRPFTPHEAQAWFHFWFRIGERMGLTDIPTDREAYDAWIDRYEAEQMVPTEATRRVVDATLGIVKAWLPAPMRPMVSPTVRAMLRPRLLAAAEMKPAPAGYRWLIGVVLRARATMKRFLPLEAYGKPLGADGYRTYPAGMPPIESIGPGSSTH